MSSSRWRVNKQSAETHKPSPRRFLNLDQAVQQFSQGNEISGQSQNVRRKPQFISPHTISTKHEEDESSVTSTSKLRASGFLQASADVPTDLADPLPDVFSPHKRKQRFITDGIALLIQSWISDLGTSYGNEDLKTPISFNRYVIKVISVDIDYEHSNALIAYYNKDGILMTMILLNNATHRISKVKEGSILSFQQPNWAANVDQIGQIYTIVDWFLVNDSNS